MTEQGPFPSVTVSRVGKAIGDTAGFATRTMVGWALAYAPRHAFGLAFSNVKMLMGAILVVVVLAVGLVSAPVLAVVFGLAAALNAGVPLGTVDRTGEAASLGPGLLLCPVQNPVITQPFGPTTFVGEPIVNGVPFHTGIDLAVPMGRPIVAASSGTVTFAAGQTNPFGLLVGDGQYVTITDPQVRVELYGPMSSRLSGAGQVLQ